jgi:hypothetical protein
MTKSYKISSRRGQISLVMVTPIITD